MKETQAQKLIKDLQKVLDKYEIKAFFIGAAVLESPSIEDEIDDITDVFKAKGKFSHVIALMQECYNHDPEFRTVLENLILAN